MVTWASSLFPALILLLITHGKTLKPDILFITGDFFSDKQKWELPIRFFADRK
jgi:predicted MPP superfamily phosphohydrolase